MLLRLKLNLKLCNKSLPGKITSQRSSYTDAIIIYAFSLFFNYLLLTYWFVLCRPTYRVRQKSIQGGPKSKPLHQIIKKWY